MTWLPAVTLAVAVVVVVHAAWVFGVRYGQRLERDALRDRVEHANETIGRAEVARRAVAAEDRYVRALRSVEPFERPR